MLFYFFQMTTIDVAVHYQMTNSKGKMLREEVLKFLPILAKAKNISSDWKQILIEDSAWIIDGESSPVKKTFKKGETKGKEETNENTSDKAGKDVGKNIKQDNGKTGRPRLRSEISKFV